jgi:hypothetical protein
MSFELRRLGLGLGLGLGRGKIQCVERLFVTAWGGHTSSFDMQFMDFKTFLYSIEPVQFWSLQRGRQLHGARETDVRKNCIGPYKNL